MVAAGACQMAAGLYIPAKARLAQWLIGQAWEEARASDAGVRPWSWADTAAIGRLRVPQHGKDFIVLAGVSGEALAFGPGHLAASAQPGSAGHTIIGGHRDTHFGFLKHVTAGDQLELEGIGGTRRSYRVDAVRVVNIDFEPLELQPERSHLTLVTCYPFDAVSAAGPLRYLVEASAHQSEARSVRF